MSTVAEPESPRSGAALGPYARSARAWRSAGWLGTLPVVGKDANVPPGFTGHRGVWPSGDQVAQWIERRGSDNILIRLPKTVIGIDVDGYYDGERYRVGIETIEKFSEWFGDLPPTYVSTAREDGSGIRLFRVPEGISWVSDLGRNSDVQICRYEHRYVMAWPSIHPRTGGEYRLWYPSKEEHGRLKVVEKIPRPEDLPELPDSWVQGLTKRNNPTFNFGLPDAVSRETRAGGADGSEDGVTRGTAELDSSRRVDPELMLLIGAPPGEQDDLLYRYLCSLRAKRMSEDEAIALGIVAIQRMTNARTDDPWTPQHVIEKVRRIWATHPAGTSLEQSVTEAQRAWARGFVPAQRPGVPDGAMGTASGVLGAPAGAGGAAGGTVPGGALPGAGPAGGAGGPADLDPDPDRLTEDDLPPENLTDTGNSDRFARLYAKSRLRYVPETKLWHIWDGNRWRIDVRNEAFHMTRFVADDIRSDATIRAAIATDDRREQIIRQYGDWARISESVQSRKNILTAAAADSRFIVSDSQIDADPRLLACENGVIELTDDGWSFRPTVSTDNVSLNTNFHFDPSETSEDWERFLRYVQPNPVIRRHLQAVDGYSLFGANPLRMWVIIHGPTSTGKTTHLELIGDTLGDYASVANLTVFRDNQDEKPRPDIVSALPCRRIHMSEAETEKYLHGDQIKRATGGEHLRARTPYARTLISRVPAFLPFMAANNVPTIESADEALNKRLHVIPFVSRLDRDPSGDIINVVARLRENPPKSAILAYMLEGWKLYRAGVLEEELPELDEAKAAVSEQFSSFSDFIRDFCEVDANYSETSIDLYNGYCVWAQQNGADKISHKKFGIQLGRLPQFKSRKNVWVTYANGSTAQKAVWYGLRIAQTHRQMINWRLMYENPGQ